MSRRRTHERHDANPLEIAAFIGLCVFAAVVLALASLALLVEIGATS